MTCKVLGRRLAFATAIGTAVAITVPTFAETPPSAAPTDNGTIAITGWKRNPDPFGTPTTGPVPIVASAELDPASNARANIIARCQNNGSLNLTIGLVNADLDVKEHDTPHSQYTGNNNYSTWVTHDISAAIRVKVGNNKDDNFSITPDNSRKLSIELYASGDLVNENTMLVGLPMEGTIYALRIALQEPAFANLLAGCVVVQHRVDKENKEQHDEQQETDRVRELCQQLKSCVDGCKARSSNPRSFYGDACSDNCATRFSAMPDGACANF